MLSNESTPMKTASVLFRAPSLALVNRAWIFGLVIAAMCGLGHSADARAEPAGKTPSTDTSAPATSQLPDVDVIAPQPPTDAELAGDSVYQFVVHHATTPYPSSQGAVGSLTRWRGGRPETMCPTTLGLDPGYNAFITARIRALAAKVGAPVQSDASCKENVRILFTTEPDKLMGAVYQWAASSLGYKHPDQPEKLLQQSSSQAIQAWYVTAAGGQRILNRDAAMLGRLDLLPLWPLTIQTSIHGNGCCYGGIAAVIVVVNTTLVSGYSIGSVADYIAMISLTLVQSPNHCDPLPSILDLMSATCGAREKPTGITAGDLAFLKALYYHNTGVGPTLSRDAIQNNMLQQFKGELL